MKNLKKNQVVIYVIALMLVVAGYLNYTTKSEKSIETAVSANAQEKTDDEELGDAKLVSNNNIVTDNNDNVENKTIEEKQNENNVVETNSNQEKKEEQKETNNTKQTAIAESDNYFENSKLERNQMYSQMLETYEEMIKSGNTSETQKAIATEEITKINNNKNAIMICENLISTKGFLENVIFVNNDSVNVVVKADELKTEEIAQIQNIISREMKVEIENIHIMNK